MRTRPGAKIHNLLDGEPVAGGPDADLDSLVAVYRRALAPLESSFEPAPAGFRDRVMAALPSTVARKPRPALRAPARRESPPSFRVMP